MTVKFKTWMGKLFSSVFLALALVVLALAGYQCHLGLAAGKELTGVFVHMINTVIIALALFELGLGISKEYGASDDDHDTYSVVRRTIARFVGTVCIALVLESLIMVIKYSQLDLAGNLHYPVAIMAGASVLLAGMGLFLHLTRADCAGRDEGVALWQPPFDQERLPARADQRSLPLLRQREACRSAERDYQAR